MWVQLAILVVSMLVSYTTRPKQAAPKATAFEDFDFPQSVEGTPQI